ncbi:glycosyltransferase family 4 protein [bacterium]|nr:glycosyltransferase family 4 protein [candidate division CSSED10-310 bacterium]
MITVIHVDTERTWRGGEGQVLKLACGLKQHEIRSVIAAPSKSALMDRAKEAGLDCLTLRSTGELSIRQIKDVLRGTLRFNADLIHVHTSHGLVSSAIVRYLVSHPVKIIYSRRTDFHLRTGFLNLSRNKYRWGADRILSVSNGIKHVLVSDGIPEYMITTVYSGIDLSSFDPSDDGSSLRSELNIPLDSIVVGMVAALVPHKDPFTFLRAAEILERDNTQIVFILIGAGSMWGDLQAALNESPARNRFLMPGFRNDVSRFLAIMDVFCMSSREEGLCTSILDAMAMSKPVVATRAGGIPEAVEDNVTGLLVPVENPAAFASAISTLVNDPGKRISMGAAGRARVQDLFDVRDTVAKTAAVYRELLDENE